MLSCSRAGLSFSQGIHGHGIWMGPSCVSHCRSAVQRFGNSYAYLADYCLKQGYCLYGMVPKLHSYMHFRTDFDDSLKEGRENTLNPAVFDNSMSEDFVGRISRQSRRVPFKRIEWTILRCYMVKAKLQIKRVCKLGKLGKRRCVWKKSEAWTEWNQSSSDRAAKKRAGQLQLDVGVKTQFGHKFNGNSCNLAAVLFFTGWNHIPKS